MHKIALSFLAAFTGVGGGGEKGNQFERMKALFP